MAQGKPRWIKDRETRTRRNLLADTKALFSGRERVSINFRERILRVFKRFYQKKPNCYNLYTGAWMLLEWKATSDDRFLAVLSVPYHAILNCRSLRLLANSSTFSTVLNHRKCGRKDNINPHHSLFGFGLIGKLTLAKNGGRVLAAPPSATDSAPRFLAWICAYALSLCIIARLQRDVSADFIMVLPLTPFHHICHCFEN